MVYTIQHYKNSPVFWQTYLPDLASITMEGILIFNKHLLFLLIVIVLLLSCIIFYTKNNPKNEQKKCSKDF